MAYTGLASKIDKQCQNISIIIFIKKSTKLITFNCYIISLFPKQYTKKRKHISTFPRQFILLLIYYYDCVVVMKDIKKLKVLTQVSAFQQLMLFFHS